MKLLEQLATTAGVSGREDRIRELIIKQTKGLFDEVRVDAMGSLICVRKPRVKAGGRKKKNPTKVMLAAHMDQIGFLVRHIDKDGFITVNAVGGFDTRNLFARLVTVCSKGGDLTGVMNASGKPVHIASTEDRKKIPEISELIVDLGLPGAEVKKKVQIGDVVVLKSPVEMVGNTVVSQCLDNRVACWLLIRAMEKLKVHDCEIYCVFTVQEEVGLRGATTSAYAIEPDIGIAVDTTLCVDTPGVPEPEQCAKQGQGVGLMVMDSAAIADYKLLQEFEAVAKKKKIKAQRTILPRGGTDSGGIQKSRAGHRVMAVVCPTRYIHTVTEMIHLEDLHASRDLLTAYLGQVK